jgi:hypothetical protein
MNINDDRQSLNARSCQLCSLEVSEDGHLGPEGQGDQQGERETDRGGSLCHGCEDFLKIVSKFAQLVEYLHDSLHRELFTHTEATEAGKALAQEWRECRKQHRRHDRLEKALCSLAGVAEAHAAQHKLVDVCPSTSS